MIIDCHTHVNNYHNEQVASLQQCMDDLRLAMRRNRVDIALVLTSYKITPGRPATRDVVKITSGMTNVFVVAGISYSTFSPDQLSELREYIQDGFVRGLKLYLNRSIRTTRSASRSTGLLRRPGYPSCCTPAIHSLPGES
jgi:hypothetical protein